ncbi:hypothetical protein PRZ48_015064 [Zasmidium cellare]|uniref:Zn(2)-C6 fungal-type domain-containing protein n=1 Tax=Zasmidium cellare TaxID=395010 RepID=A0ABR0DXJ6_ZASCE|nr:hypothetical protein PRZ48_015064 [Zasmidium cellare]
MPSPEASQQPGSDVPTPPVKRQRVSQACNNCKNRKTRCDGRQPVCQACESRGVSSTCNFEQTRRQRARVSYASPQHQNAYRTEPIAHNDAAQALSDLGRSQNSMGNGTQPSKTQPNIAVQSLQSQPDLSSRRDTIPPISRTQPSEIANARPDGLATVAAGSDDAMYGPSSTMAFLKHVMPNQSRHGSVTPGGHPQSSGRASLDVKGGNTPALPDRIAPRTDGLAVLPMRRQADNFLLCYWEFIHPLFPVLHKPTFLRKYDRLWIEGDEAQTHYDTEAEEAIFTSTLNLVFALGCKFSGLIDASQKASVADDFYQRSRQSYPFDILDSTSISLVQMLILTGVYLQSTQYASRCWNSVGLAIRMAQSLGLHVDHSSRKSITQLELEMRRRIWHTCVHLDRLLAMTFGRPSMIGRNTDVPIPDLIDDEYLGDRSIGSQPETTHSRLGLFVSSCRLFDLLEEVLELFYRDSSGVVSHRQIQGVTRTAELLTPVLDLNRRLDEFVEGVPDYLQVPARPALAATHDDHIHLQQQVLYCRFLYVRLLLLRPLLLMATRRDTKPATSSSLDDEVIRSCCNLCALTACRLIDTLYANLGTLYRSSGWHTVYFTFSAAIVLLASSKIEEVQQRVAESDMEASWNRCLLILDHYENQIQSAHQAKHILRTMKTRISDVARAQDQQTGFTHINTVAKPAQNGNGSAPEADIYAQLNLDDIDLFSADNISEAWFGQQLINLDWLELPQY